MSEALSRLHQLVLAVSAEWKAATPRLQAATRQGEQTREMRDFVEMMSPAYDLLQSSSSEMQKIAQAEQLLKAELWIVKRLLYKNKNQHAHAHYWRHMVHARKVIENLLDLHLPQLHQHLPFSPPAKVPTDTPKGGKKAPAAQHSAPTKLGLESVLYWLLAVAVYINEVVSVLEKGAVDMLALIEQAFFMPFAITVLSTVSRFYALCKFIIVQLSCLYGALHRALEFYPANKAQQEREKQTDGQMARLAVDRFAALLGALPVLLETRLKESETAQSVALAKVMRETAASYQTPSAPPTPAPAPSSIAAAAALTPVTKKEVKKRKAEAAVETTSVGAVSVTMPTPTPTKAKTQKPAQKQPPPLETAATPFKYRENARAKKRLKSEASAAATPDRAAAASPSSPLSSSSSAAGVLRASALPATTTQQQHQHTPATPMPTNKKKTDRTPTKAAAMVTTPTKAHSGESLDDIMAALLPGKKAKTAPGKAEALQPPPKALLESPKKKMTKKTKKERKEGGDSLDNIFASLLPSSSSSSNKTGKKRKSAQG